MADAQAFLRPATAALVVLLLLAMGVPADGANPRESSAHDVAVEMGLEAPPTTLPPSPLPGASAVVDLRPTPPVEMVASGSEGSSRSDSSSAGSPGSGSRSVSGSEGGSRSDSSSAGSPGSGSRSVEEINPLAEIKPVTIVRFNTTRGSVDVEVHYDWAPLGAAQFLSLVMAGFYDGCYIFRVVQGFVAQAGINSDPRVQKDYEAQSIKDDPASGHSNALGTLSFE